MYASRTYYFYFIAGTGGIYSAHEETTNIFSHFVPTALSHEIKAV